MCLSYELNRILEYNVLGYELLVQSRIYHKPNLKVYRIQPQ